jgi:hypothetical protein
LFLFALVLVRAAGVCQIFVVFFGLRALVMAFLGSATQTQIFARLLVLLLKSWFLLLEVFDSVFCAAADFYAAVVGQVPLKVSSQSEVPAFGFE